MKTRNKNLKIVEKGLFIYNIPFLASNRGHPCDEHMKDGTENADSHGKLVDYL